MTGCGATNCLREFLARWLHGEFPGEGAVTVSACEDCREVVEKFKGDGS